jgi:hypothetical protein
MVTWGLVYFDLSPSRPSTARFISEFPGHNGGLIDVTTNKSLDIVFISGDNSGIGVEEIVRLTSTDELVYINIHTTVVGPVICPRKKLLKKDYEYKALTTQQ